VTVFISSFWLLESLVIAVTGWESEEVLMTTGKADLAKIGSSVHLRRFQDRWVKAGLIASGFWQGSGITSYS